MTILLGRSLDDAHHHSYSSYYVHVKVITGHQVVRQFDGGDRSSLLLVSTKCLSFAKKDDANCLLRRRFFTSAKVLDDVGQE